MSGYAEFLERKSQLAGAYGFELRDVPGFLFPFQAALFEFAIRRGRSGIFADCGLGKTPLQLAWADAIARHAGKPVLILTPLAVAQQTVREAEKFGIEACRSSDGSAHHITVTNYERLHHFSPDDFAAVVCDESSILKHFTGATQKIVTRFMSKHRWRLLCTATAAPNDYYELGTSAEALGEMGYSDMLSRFFKQEDAKKFRMNDVKLARGAKTGNHFQKLAYRVSQQIGAWRLKGHAEEPFWRWVASWARACRKPSDLGFPDDGFVLPPLIENEHIVKPRTNAEGVLFSLPAFGLQEEREERRRTIQERCEKVAELCEQHERSVVWCHMNPEGLLLRKLLPDSVEVSGAHSDKQKEETFTAFGRGEIKRLITKPKIGAWGLNWQHCAHVVTFASHSYEQYYQSVRRCWRYGQTRPVTVDIVSTEGEQRVRENMQRKSDAAAQMFERLVHHMNNALHLERREFTTKMEVPAWLSQSK